MKRGLYDRGMSFPKERTVYLIDGSAQFHRAYFAIKSLSTSRGLPTNATYGFTTMLRKLYEDEQPQWVGISFDLPGPTFRHDAYAEYKAHRRAMDQDLSVQIPYVRRVCEAFCLPVIEVPGFEADDVIATLAAQAVAQDLKVIVVSGDKDLLQLVSDDVWVLNPGREGSGSVLYDPKAVEEKIGVPPSRVIDVMALVGDAVDNVPGVPGIGEKGARDLIREYGSLEAVLDNAERVKRASYREGLLAHRESAVLSKQLVTLKHDIAIVLDLDRLKRPEPNRRLAHALFTELEFAALAREYAPEIEAVVTTHRVAEDAAAIGAIVSEAQNAGRAACALVTTSREPMRAELLGVAVAVSDGSATYVPLPAAEAAARLDLLRPIFEDAKIAWLSGNAKHDQVVLARRGITCRGLTFDALVASYLLNPGRRSHSLEELALECLRQKIQPVAAVLAPSGRQGVLEGWDDEALAGAAAQQADVVLRVAEQLMPRLEEDGLAGIYRDLELPLVGVLADMERAGVAIDREHLAAMSRDMERQIADLTRDIYAMAGGEININSPIQLREVLFDKLGLKSAKKTAKTRAASTAEEVLEELSLSHPLPRKILEYRSVQKLKSTYVDALPALVNPTTGRIHASFNQTVAATGRISSSDPNLQNIPIRAAEGRRIRQAFIADPGHLILSADYSQIELRILAHLSKDATLVDTFRRGEDIHDRTSREVFGAFSSVPADEQRRISKMINYALLYGKTAFTLAKDIGVTQKEAQAFIQAYFERYPSVRGFIDDTIARARETGMVRTLLGRLRRLPDLKSRNPQVRAEAERQAMNTPVQGSAADLIKKAMLDLDAALRARGSAARLIMQIHDELVLEVAEREAEDIRALVQQIMEGALQLDVPLVAEARLGKNWAEAH
jgi:DNA polymerase-1